MSGRLIYLMGPSGAGKDSLIDAARQRLAAIGCEVVQRVITRSAESVGEDAHGVGAAEFNLLREQGAFALSWQANGLAYGIPMQIDEWLAAGRHVLVNGSRAHLAQARQRYPELIAIFLTVDVEVLRQRLVSRGRENTEEIDARLKRNGAFSEQVVREGGGHVLSLDNSGKLATTVVHLMALLQSQGVSAAPDQT